MAYLTTLYTQATSFPLLAEAKDSGREEGRKDGWNKITDSCCVCICVCITAFASGFCIPAAPTLGPAGVHTCSAGATRRFLSHWMAGAEAHFF